MSRRKSSAGRLRKVALLLLVLVAVGFTGLWHSGAWNLAFPSHSHDVEAPLIPADLASPSILVFSKTNGFRHRDGIAAGVQFFKQVSWDKGWGVFSTENGAVFQADILERFDAVVFLNATGDMLSTGQEKAFQHWLEAGGGWLGIHAAGDSSHRGWSWYMENLVGPLFTAHTLGPQIQRATVMLENQQHPALTGLPDLWSHEDEWYSWAQSPRALGFTILASVDEDSYTPVQKIFNREKDLRMGDHPIIWSKEVGQGRALYSALGHQAESFDNPRYQHLLRNALIWLMGGAVETTAVQGSSE